MLKDQPSLSYLYSVRLQKSVIIMQMRRSCWVSSPRRKPCGRPVRNVLVTVLLVAKSCHPGTYSPCTSQPSDDTARDHGGPQTPRALEDHAGNSAGDHAVQRVVLAAVVSDSAVETVVHHRDHAGRVAQEGTSPCDGVEDGVETKLWGRGCGKPVQAFCQTPHTTHRQCAQVCHASAVAEVIRPASRRQE